MKRLDILSALSVCTFAVVQPQPKIIRVPQDYGTIQSAINAATNSDTVLVSEGVYYENIMYNGKKIVVASMYARDRDTSHISKTVIDGSRPSDANRASAVWFNGTTDTNSVLMGFTIRGGSGTTQSSPEVWKYGGGVAVGRWEDTTSYGATIKFNRICQNTMTGTTSGPFSDGCAIAAWQGRGMIIIEDNSIEQNAVNGPAGSNVVSIDDIDCRIVRNIVRNNSVANFGFAGGAYGAGINVQGFSVEVLPQHKKLWTAIIRENTVSNNSITLGRGGGISVRGDSLYAIIEKNTVTGNYAGIRGGGVSVDNSARALIRNNVISGNSASGTGEYVAAGGVGIFNHSIASLERNTIEQNIAQSDGGGVCVFLNSAASILNNKIIGNMCPNSNDGDGAGIIVKAYSTIHLENNLILNNKALYGGGLAVTIQSVADLINNTFTGNRSTLDTGGAVMLYDWGTLRLLNNIFWGDTAQVGAEFYSFPIGAYGARQSFVYTSHNIASGITGPGDINSDPLFKSTHPDSIGWFRSNSPCKNAGASSATVGEVFLTAPSKDFYGHNRDAQPDIGAFEDGIWSDVEKIASDLPHTFVLCQNFPNPFNPETRIEFSIPQSSIVNLKIFDLLGREVALLVNETKTPGTYTATWNASAFPSGVYFYQLRSGNYVETKKLMLMK